MTTILVLAARAIARRGMESLPARPHFSRGSDGLILIVWLGCLGLVRFG